jgi:phosphinothricin acetyltransferase
MHIRDATPGDASAVAAIYAHHVLNGTASFDDRPPDTDFWHDKIALVVENGWPFLVAEEGGEAFGYAYATQFRDRPAYAHTCENSIYIHPDRVGRGIGRLLLGELIARAKTAGFRQMIGVIGGAEPASVALHHALGFSEAGRMKSVGFKFGRWLDTLYMQRSLVEPGNES